MSVASSTRTTGDDTGDSEDWFVRQTENQNHSAENPRVNLFAVMRVISLI